MQHYPEVGLHFFQTAQTILPPPSGDARRAWNALNGNLKGGIPILTDYINIEIRNEVRGSLEQDIDRLSRIEEPRDLVEIEQRRAELIRLGEQYSPFSKESRLPESKSQQLLQLIQRYETLYLTKVKEHLADLEKQLRDEAIQTATPNDFYTARHQINALKSKKYPPDIQGRLNKLDEQCEAKLLELGKGCLTILQTDPPVDAEMEGKVRDEFRTCFRNLSLVGKLELKNLVAHLPDGDMKKSFQAHISAEEKKWAWQMSLRPQRVEASLSEVDQNALKMEKEAYGLFRTKFKAAQEKKAAIDKAKREGKQVEATQEELHKPLTPIVDALNMVEDFRTKSTARISPYFKTRIELFDTLVELTKNAVGDEIKAYADLVKSLVREQKGTSVSPEEVKKRMGLIAGNLGEAADDQRVTNEIMEEIGKPLPTFATKLPPSSALSTASIQDAVVKGVGSTEYKTAVKTIAQDLFVHTAVAFLNDSIADIRLAQSPKYNQQLSRAGINIKNYSIADILASPDLETGQKKCQFWIDVAEECRANGNLVALGMILGTLNDANVSKLAPKDDPRYVKRLADLNDLVLEARENFKNVRAYQRQRLEGDPPLPLIPSLAPFDIDFEHVGENTAHDKGDVVEKMASEMEQIRENLAAEVNRVAARQTTDLSRRLDSIREMPSTDLTMCKFIPSAHLLKKIETATSNLNDGSMFTVAGLTLSPDLMAAIDLDEDVDFTKEGKLAPRSEVTTQKSISNLKAAYETKVMQPAREAVAKLADPDPVKREEALQSLEKMARFLTSKSRSTLQKSIDEMEPKAADLEEAKLVLNPFEHAKVLVTRLSDPKECEKAAETLARVYLAVPDSLRPLLNAQKEQIEVQPKISNKVKAIFM